MYIRIGNSNIFCRWVKEDGISKNTPLVIFLHHGLGSISQWYDYPDEFSKITGFPVLVYDRTGHGKSSGLIYNEPDPVYLEKEACHFLPALIEKLGISEPVILYGHSDGGTIALMYAALYPEKVLAVISESGHVINEESIKSGIINTTNEYKNGDLRSKLTKYHGDKTDSLFYRWANTWTNKKSMNWDITTILGTVTSPVLCIQGELDEYGSTEQINRLIQSISGSHKTLLVPGCRHYPFLTHREQVLQEVIDFVYKNS